MTVIATIIVLGVLIFVHELGHFWAAKAVGIEVQRFSIGLGPRVWGYTKGETEYVLSAIPLGGYVKMAGMDDEVMEAIEGGGEPGVKREKSSRDYDSKPIWARTIVISAGVVMNMIFAFAAFTLVAGVWGSPAPDTTRVGGVRAEWLPAGTEALGELTPGAHIQSISGREVRHWGEVRDAVMSAPAGPATVQLAEPDASIEIVIPSETDARRNINRALDVWHDPVAGVIEPGGPADRGGLRPGDRIVEMNGTPVEAWPEVVRVIESRPDLRTEIVLLRDGGRVTRSVTPRAVEGRDPVTGETRTIGQIGLGPAGGAWDIVYTRVGIAEAVSLGWAETVGFTQLILGFLRDLFTGQLSVRSLGSIVTIGEASGAAAAEGMATFLRFMGLFSINLAILNLLPIPILDGGHLLFLAIEAIRGQALSVEQRMRWSQVGFIVIIGIMVLALGNDFLRLFGL